MNLMPPPLQLTAAGMLYNPFMMTAQATDIGLSSHAAPEDPSVPIRPRKPVPTTLDWENIRPIFTQLYSIENKELRIVKQILADEHGFHAT